LPWDRNNAQSREGLPFSTMGHRKEDLQFPRSYGDKSMCLTRALHRLVRQNFDRLAMRFAGAMPMRGDGLGGI
jgi:hypothetical protein